MKAILIFFNLLIYGYFINTTYASCRPYFFAIFDQNKLRNSIQSCKKCIWKLGKMRDFDSTKLYNDYCDGKRLFIDQTAEDLIQLLIDSESEILEIKNTDHDINYKSSKFLNKENYFFLEFSSCALEPDNKINLIKEIVKRAGLKLNIYDDSLELWVASRVDTLILNSVAKPRPIDLENLGGICGVYDCLPEFIKLGLKGYTIHYLMDALISIDNNRYYNGSRKYFKYKIDNDYLNKIIAYDFEYPELIVGNFKATSFYLYNHYGITLQQKIIPAKRYALQKK